MSDESTNERVWADIVECCMDDEIISINVGSDVRRAAILWANERVYPTPQPEAATVTAEGEWPKWTHVEGYHFLIEWLGQNRMRDHYLDGRAQAVSGIFDGADFSLCESDEITPAEAAALIAKARGEDAE